MIAAGKFHIPRPCSHFLQRGDEVSRLRDRYLYQNLAAVDVVGQSAYQAPSPLIVDVRDLHSDPVRIAQVYLVIFFERGMCVGQGGLQRAERCLRLIVLYAEAEMVEPELLAWLRCIDAQETAPYTKLAIVLSFIADGQAGEGGVKLPGSCHIRGVKGDMIDRTCLKDFSGARSRRERNAGRRGESSQALKELSASQGPVFVHLKKAVDVGGHSSLLKEILRDQHLYNGRAPNGY